MDRYACNVAENNWRYYQKFDSARRSSLGRNAPSNYNNYLPMDGEVQNSQTTCPQYPSGDHIFPFEKIKFLLGWVGWRYGSVKECTSFRWHLDTVIQTKPNKNLFFSKGKYEHRTDAGVLFFLLFWTCHIHG